jgi:hypothetical protein
MEEDLGFVSVSVSVSIPVLGFMIGDAKQKFGPGSNAPVPRVTINKIRIFNVCIRYSKIGSLPIAFGRIPGNRVYCKISTFIYTVVSNCSIAWPLFIMYDEIGDAYIHQPERSKNT